MKQVATMDIVSKLRIGMTRDEVIALLGQPDDVSVLGRKERRPGIYKYGEIELHFEPGSDGKLRMAYTETVSEDGEREGIVLLQ